jgi:O-antigen/teichoic acid export membrane protein
MAGSSALRLTSGVLLFVGLARFMGSTQFGVLMTWFAIAGLCALPVNFGLSLFFLREASRDHDRGASLLNQVLGLKLLIFIVILTLICIASLFLEIPAKVLLPLFIMFAAESFTEIFCAQLRVLGRYSIETKFVSKQSILQFAIVAAFAIFDASPNTIALAFAISRLISMWVALSTVTAINTKTPSPAFANAYQTIRRSISYFADFGFQSSLVQVDVVLLSAFSGPTAVGIYQAGMKIAHGLSQLISIMVNVALPHISQKLIKEQLDGRLSFRVYGIFLLAGLFVSIPIYTTASWLGPLMYGPTYVGLPDIFRILAIFLIIRFVGAAAGVLLIASGEQVKRASVMAIALLVLILSSATLAPAHGALGVAIAMCIAYAFISISLGTILFFRIRNIKNVDRKP